MKKLLVFYFVCVSTIFLACNNSASTNREDTSLSNVPAATADSSNIPQAAIIEDIHWQLVSLNNEAVSIPTSGKDLFLEFNGTEQRVHGFSGCNIINGGYTKQDNQLSFTQMVSTRMTCPEQGLEDKFITAINSINHYKLDDAGLHLLKGDTTVASFKAVTK
ncbi:heat shock protein HslJ [Chitinophaga skermanii]|uniref:Heat shock protein HslJ n=1 Tax=Chitinophaga skermanii TaxID=331697 RepID=A0A327QAC4_9BACT|nr:META domain-containing protein [Chitinophaga skermanii]RAI98756.1 heat shock protein HslJ [Chitinophaga skermanii]